MRQIGSGMYGAIIVSDTPRDTTRDQLVVAGGGGLPMFYKQAPTFLLVNGSAAPRPLRMTVGDTVVAIQDVVFAWQWLTARSARARLSL